MPAKILSEIETISCLKGWGGRPWIFLPLPLLLASYFLAAAKDTVLDASLSQVLEPPLEVVGLTKGPLFLRMACCHTSRA